MNYSRGIIWRFLFQPQFLLCISPQDIVILSHSTWIETIAFEGSTTFLTLSLSLSLSSKWRTFHSWIELAKNCWIDPVKWYECTSREPKSPMKFHDYEIKEVGKDGCESQNRMRLYTRISGFRFVTPDTILSISKKKGKKNLNLFGQNPHFFFSY